LERGEGYEGKKGKSNKYQQHNLVKKDILRERKGKKE